MMSVLNCLFFGNVTIVLVRRFANCVAHVLAKAAVSLAELVEWFTVLSYLILLCTLILVINDIGCLWLSKKFY